MVRDLNLLTESSKNKHTSGSDERKISINEDPQNHSLLSFGSNLRTPLTDDSQQNSVNVNNLTQSSSYHKTESRPAGKHLSNVLPVNSDLAPVDGPTGVEPRAPTFVATQRLKPSLSDITLPESSNNNQTVDLLASTGSH